MTSKKKRLGKLVEHRARELDKRVSSLTATRSLEREAEERAQRDREQHSRAIEGRQQVLSSTLDAKTLMEASDFLVSCANRREVAEQRLGRARRAVLKAQGEVQSARNDLKKIELLTERIATEERVQAARVEQRTSDDWAALRQGENNRRRSES